jgi:hypothetical protein
MSLHRAMDTIYGFFAGDPHYGAVVGLAVRERVLQRSDDEALERLGYGKMWRICVDPWRLQNNVDGIKMDMSFP